jgi:tetraacyldisaccharide-1-P 4'-kinase
MLKDVRILFVGDRTFSSTNLIVGGTGKTSLILAVVKERFETEVMFLSASE